MADNSCSSWMTSSMEHAGSSTSSWVDETRLRLPTVDTSAPVLATDSESSGLSDTCWLYSCNEYSATCQYNILLVPVKMCHIIQSSNSTSRYIFVCTYAKKGQQNWNIIYLKVLTSVYDDVGRHLYIKMFSSLSGVRIVF